MQSKLQKAVSWVIVLLLSFAGFTCKKEFNKITSPDWNPAISLPFIKTVVNLNDLVEEDSNIVINDDNSLKIVFNKDSIIDIQVDEVFELPDQQENVQNFNLGDISFPGFSISDVVQLNEVIGSIDQDARDSLIKYDGKIAIFPPVSLEEVFRTDYYTQSNFKSLVFAEGMLLLKITNGIPVRIDDLTIRVVNTSREQIIAEFDFTQINSNETLNDSVDLTGMEIYNSFGFEVVSLNSQGSYPDSVMINLSDSLMLELNAYNLKVSSGEGFITEQIIISEEKFVDFSFEDEARVNKLSFEQGQIDYTVNSDFAMPVNVLLRLPSVRQNNEIPEKFFVINPGQTKNLNWDISNSIFDLSTNPEQDYNSFPVEYTVVINASGIPVIFSSDDALQLVFQARQLAFSGAEGYLGKRAFNIAMDSIKPGLEFFENFEGNIKLTEPEILFRYSSSIGVPLNFKLAVQGINKAGEVEELNADTFRIDKPDHPGETIHRVIKVNKDNSSVIDFLSILPDVFIYEGSGLTNSSGQQNNFINKDSEIILGMTFDFPLSLSTDNLTFLDTVDVNLENSVDQIESGVLHLVVNNGFPFDVQINLEILDPKTSEIVKIIAFDKIKAGKTNPSGKVIEAEETYIRTEVDNYTYNKFKVANHSILKIKMKTNNSGMGNVVLYTDYKIGINMGFEVQTDL